MKNIYVNNYILTYNRKILLPLHFNYLKKSKDIRKKETVLLNKIFKSEYYKTNKHLHVDFYKSII